MTSEITNPSRRSVAKGAAWAVPAVAVAATAPSLSASPLPDCTGTELILGVADCRLIGVLSPEATFTITNPASSGCDVPAGTEVQLSGGALAEIGLAAVVELNVGVLTYDSDLGIVTLTQPLAAGDPPLTIRVFPSGLNINVLGTYTMNVLGASANFTLAAGAGELLSICTSPDD